MARIDVTDSPNFIEQKNAETNKPIWLYRAEISDVRTEDLFLAEYDEDVYFASYVTGTVSTNGTTTITGAGTSWSSSTLEVGEQILIGSETTRYTITAITDTTHIEVTPAHPDTQAGETYVIFRRYLRFPITHQGINENTEGSVNGMSVSVANASREIQAHLELRNGLLERMVTVRQVFADYLDDPTCYIEEKRFVDSTEANVSAVTFNLTSKIDLLDIRVPRRNYMRDHCAWEYKATDGGCWLSPPAGAPSGFSTDKVPLHLPEVNGTTDIPLHSSVVSAMTSDDGKDAAEAGVGFSPKSIPELDKTEAVLNIDMIVSDPTVMEDGTAQIEISSSGTHDANEWAIGAAQIEALTFNTTWTTYALPLSAVFIEHGALDKNAINYLRWYHYSTSTAYRMVIKWKNASITASTTTSIAQAKFRPVDAKGLTKANGKLVIDLKCDQPSKIGAVDSQIELTSSGKPDEEEWHLANLTGSGWNEEAQAITTNWQTFTIPLSTWVTTSGGVSDLDVEAINFLRVYAYSTDATPLSLDWKNAYLSWPGMTDACDKTLRNCKWHNNAARFGGFPGIPSRRTSRE